MATLWVKNGLVWTGGDAARVFSGGVLSRDGRVVGLGADHELQADGDRADQVIDAGGRLILPGFINAHMHLYSTLARGMALKDPPPADFTEILQRLWWRLDRALTLEDLGPGAEVVLLDALRAGVTTLIDHHASPNAIDGSLDVLAQAARTVGLRLSTCYEVSDRDGPEKTRAGIRENLRFHAACQDQPMLVGMFGLHASFTLSPESLEACAQAGKDAGIPFHVHVAEAQSDREHARRAGFKGALHRLHAARVITENSLAVHCVHTSPDEWDLLRESGAFTVHNPQSNMNNAVGAAPIAEMMAAGVPVGVGTDGMQADVREDIRAAFLLGHHLSGDPRSLWAEIPALLDANRRLASSLFGLPLGELSPGAAADLVVFDYHPPTSLTPDNFIGHLLFGLYNSAAHTTVVDGRVRLSEGQPLDLDPAEVAEQARARAEALWSRF